MEQRWRGPRLHQLVGQWPRTTGQCQPPLEHLRLATRPGQRMGQRPRLQKSRRPPLKPFWSRRFLGGHEGERPMQLACCRGVQGRSPPLLTRVQMQHACCRGARVDRARECVQPTYLTVGRSILCVAWGGGEGG